MNKPLYLFSIYLDGKSRYVLCSHNWKKGDTIYYFAHGLPGYPVRTKLKEQTPKADVWVTTTNDHQYPTHLRWPDFSTKPIVAEQSWSGVKYFNIVAEVPKTGWVTPDMKFDESEVKISKRKKAQLFPSVKFKCPTCSKMH